MKPGFVVAFALLLPLGCAGTPGGPRSAGDQPDAAEADGDGMGTDGAARDRVPPDVAVDRPADRAALDQTGSRDGGSDSGTRSAGCGTRNLGGMFTIETARGPQPYIVALPRNYDSSKAYPLVFYLHGRNGSPDNRPRNLEAELTATGLAIVVYPKSIGTGWESAAMGDDPEENLKMVRAIKQRVHETTCVAVKKVVMTGFSSGGHFTSKLPCLMMGELAGIVVAGCGLVAQGRCMGAIPVVQIVGTDDMYFARAQEAADYYRQRNGCTMTRIAGPVPPCEDYQGCAPSAPTSFCVFNGGHQWPDFAATAVAQLVSRF